ncbi:hypothetical protein GPL09_15085 [Bacteroides thetaiotaomicron]|uniref:hypothetical protein n=1 Tax=Bacteroides thetaiotaomicron TaxID=818 RepID=UPI001C02AE64|nr:hypothetical protein [Bacteroides thetaiotaomicron]MBT9899720.1 hypothetical protein [Bacteroides thetaiotaomicron]
MKDIMLADTPVEQRAQILRDSCDQIVERSYTRKFDQEEINERKADLANVAIQKADLEQSLAEIRADYKGKIKPLEERIVKLRDELKAGGDWIKGECYKFVDEEEKMVGFYSPEGYLLEQRTMTQEERQRNIFRAIRGNTMDKTGTDD